MDFDHLDSETKKFNISRWYREFGKESLDEEIAKCDLICSNCHRIRTHLRSCDDKAAENEKNIDKSH